MGALRRNKSSPHPAPFPHPKAEPEAESSCVIPFSGDRIPARWLTLYANLTGSRDAQIASWLMLLGVSVRMLPEDMNVWVGGLSKGGSLPQCEQASSNPLRSSTEQKGKGSSIFSLSARLLELNRLTFFCSRSGARITSLPGSQTFGPGLK